MSREETQEEIVVLRPVITPIETQRPFWEREESFEEIFPRRREADEAAQTAVRHTWELLERLRYHSGPARDRTF